jgi:RNA polymerase sigma-70 factor (ECF subfamily)
MVYNLALRLVRDPLAAEDLAQDALIRAWRALPGFRAEARFSTWLYRIVTNVCLDRLPRMAADLVSIDYDRSDDDLIAVPDGDPAPDAAAVSAEVAAHLHQAMDALPAGFRLLLTLRYLQEMSYDEIGAVTGLPEGTVKSGIYRGRGQLKAALQERLAGAALHEHGVDAAMVESSPASARKRTSGNTAADGTTHDYTRVADYGPAAAASGSQPAMAVASTGGAL